MKTPHKHADVIKAWADGAQIQFRGEYSKSWEDCIHDPIWYENIQYRVKPDVKYRVGLLCWQGEELPFIVTNNEIEEAYEQTIHFLRWVTDWTKVETGEK